MTEQQSVSETGNTMPPNSRPPRRGTSWMWWIRFFGQPILAVACLAGILFALGYAQRSGWLPNGSANEETEVADQEDVLYICPMVCVPPSTEPGLCPVCGMRLKKQKASGDAKDKYGLTLDPASIRVANIQTVVAESVPLIREIRAIGSIQYDEGSLATIAAYFDGRIDSLYADYTGVKVAAGDALAMIYSPDLYASQVALLESLKLKQRSDAESLARIADANQRLYDSARQRLIELGLTAEQVDDLERRGTADSRIRLTSPMSGTVIEKMAVEGQYVKTGEKIYRIADLSRVWLMLRLYPADAARVGFGQRVITRIPSLPGREFVGRVAFVDPHVDPATQTVGVRVVVPNDEGLLRIGDYATATITALANAPHEGSRTLYDPELAGKWISPRHPHVIQDGPGTCRECGMDLVPASEFGFAEIPPATHFDVVVPRDAILMAGDESVVYVETEPGRFEFRNVTVGAIVGDRASIVSGVQPGERVVSTATLLVDSQFSMAGKPSLIDPTRAELRQPESGIDWDAPEVITALASLTSEEQAAVRQQEVCPVANLPLGSMGTPIKVAVGDQTIYLCCEGCRERLLGDPSRYQTFLADRAAGKASTAGSRTSELPEIQPLESNELPQISPFSDDVPESALPEMELPETPAPQRELPRLTPAGPPDHPAVTPPPAEEIEQALAALPVADRRLARQQANCPVAGLPLGSMGTPLKVDVKGRPVFICCEGCRATLLKDPDHYLALLPAEGDQ